MFPAFRKWFVPCSENGHLPYMLRAAPFFFLSILVGTLFVASSALGELLLSKDSFLGAVVASVLIDLTNDDRAIEGLHGLAANPLLTAAAQMKANDMAARGYFSHTAPDGKSPWHWFGEAGYTFSFAGENLAVFFGDSSDVERAWMNSPSHRANILNERFTEIGIATAEGFYQGERTVFVVQMFGTPSVFKPGASLVLGHSAEIQNQNEASNEVLREGEGVGEVAAGTQENVAPVGPSILYEDETFIAVRDVASTDAPASSVVVQHSTLLERALASPQALLSFAYGVIGLVAALALIFLVFLEFHIQKPASVLLALLFLFAMGALLYVGSDTAVAASVLR